MAVEKDNFKENLWKACDKLRNNMDPAEYKYVVLGLVFLKYISDSFEKKYQELVAEGEGFEEERDEYTAENIFWVPQEARWNEIVKVAKTPVIGIKIDDAMRAIEKENKGLKDVLYKVYSNPLLDKGKLGDFIDIIGGINLQGKNEKGQDVLG